MKDIKRFNDYFNSNHLNENSNDVNKSYNKILDLLKKEARRLNDDDAYELHERLKDFFNKLV